MGSGRQRVRRTRRALPFFEEPGYRARMARAMSAMPSPSNPVDLLAWVLSFAREDLDTLDADTRAARGEVLRMLSPALLRRDAWSVTFDFTTPIPNARLLALQRELRDGLHALLRGDGWTLPVPKGAQVWRVTPPNEREAQFRIGWTGDDRISFLHGTAALLVAHGGRLRACKQCGAPFLRRKRAEYCSPECGQKFRDQKKTKHLRGG